MGYSMNGKLTHWSTRQLSIIPTPRTGPRSDPIVFKMFQSYDSSNDHLMQYPLVSITNLPLSLCQLAKSFHFASKTRLIFPQAVWAHPGNSKNHVQHCRRRTGENHSAPHGACVQRQEWRPSGIYLASAQSWAPCLGGQYLPELEGERCALQGRIWRGLGTNLFIHRIISLTQ